MVAHGGTWLHMVAHGCGEHMSVLHMVAHGCRLRSCCQKLEAGQAVGPYTWLTDAVRGRMHKVAGLRAKKFCTRLQVSGPKSFAQGCRFQGQKVLHEVAVHSYTLSGSLPIVLQGLRPEFVLQGCRARGSFAYRVLGTRLQGLGPGLFCTVSL